jgi:pimeloyl-ACP methyl ester carboxylesterase
MAQKLWRRSFVAPDGVELVADHGGTPPAPAIILLHGGGQTRHSWAGAVQSLLADGWQILNFDARGHGESGWSPEGAYSLTDRARDLAVVTASLDTPFVVVGASLGGATAIQAIHDGLRPAGLVLVDIVPEPEAEGVDRIVSFMRGHQDGFATIDDAAAAVAAYNPERRAPRDAGGLMKNLRRRADGRLYWHWDPRILQDAPAVHHGVVQQAAATLATLPDLPVLLVRGLSSDVVSDAGIAAFRSLLPRLDVLDVAGAGHMVAGDRNDAFNEAIMAFVRRVLPAARATAD